MEPLLTNAIDRLVPRTEAVTAVASVSADTRHHVYYLTKPVLDAFVVQQVKMAGFQLKTGGSFKQLKLQQVPRSVKDAFRSY